MSKQYTVGCCLLVAACGGSDSIEEREARVAAIATSSTSYGTVDGGDADARGNDPLPQATYCVPFEPASEYGYQGCCGTFRQASHLSDLQPGMIFKGSGWKVFYFGSDGARYRITTTMILDSWFGPYDPDGIPLSDGSVCNLIYEVPDQVLVSIPHGQNRGSVTFRPGVFITSYSGSDRWVVSRGQVLRRLAPMGLQNQIYPESALWRFRPYLTWLLDDYSIGNDVTSVAGYDPIFELETTLEQDLGLMP